MSLKKKNGPAENRHVKLVNEMVEEVNITNVTCDEAVCKVNGESVCGAKNVELMVGGKLIEMEVDTGACMTIMSKVKYLNLFENCKLEPIQTNLTSVTGNPLKCIGQMLINVSKMSGTVDNKLNLVIIDTERDFKPLLGRNWLTILYPAWKQIFDINNVSTVN